MLTSLRPALLLLALPLCFSATPAATEGTTLRWKFQKGEVLRYRVTSEQETEVSVMPGAGMKISSAIVMNETVREVAADGTASLEMSYEALRMDSDSPMFSMHYDSTQPEGSRGEETLVKSLDPMLKARIQLKMDPTGHVSEIKGVEEMLASLSASMPKGAPGGAEMIKGMFNESSIRKMVEVNVFPATALDAGATWKHEFDMPNPMIGTLRFTMDNKFVGLEEHAGESCAKIAVGTKVSITKPPEGDSPMKFDASLGETEGKTTQWFGTKSGRMLAVEMDMDMAMTIGMPPQDGDPAHAMKIETTTSTSMHMNLIGKDEPAFEPVKKPEAKK